MRHFHVPICVSLNHGRHKSIFTISVVLKLLAYFFPVTLLVLLNFSRLDVPSQFLSCYWCPTVFKNLKLLLSPAGVYTTLYYQWEINIFSFAHFQSLKFMQVRYIFLYLKCYSYHYFFSPQSVLGFTQRHLPSNSWHHPDLGVQHCIRNLHVLVLNFQGRGLFCVLSPLVGFYYGGSILSGNFFHLLCVQLKMYSLT